MSDTTKPGAPDPDSETGIDVEEPAVDQQLPESITDDGSIAIPTPEAPKPFDPATITPRVATVGDSIAELAHMVQRLRQELRLSEGGAIKIVDLALTYHIANKQLAQANPFAGFAPQPPTETPTDG